jgi:[ribosomal protein S5]-alanine N-acetyltransferase
VPTFAGYEPVTLLRPALALEPLRASHAAEMFLALQNPTHYTFIPQNPPESLEFLRQRFERLETRRSPNRKQLWLNWAIRVPTGEAAGLVQATGFPEGHASIAYELFAAFQGRGVATDAVRAALEDLRDRAHLEKATALVDSRNVKSMALLERLGFTRIRFIKDADTFKGSISHEYEYGLDLNALR